MSSLSWIFDNYCYWASYGIALPKVHRMLQAIVSEQSEQYDIVFPAKAGIQKPHPTFGS